jgi:hypothetical protein
LGPFTRLNTVLEQDPMIGKGAEHNSLYRYPEQINGISFITAVPLTVAAQMIGQPASTGCILMKTALSNR